MQASMSWAAAAAAAAAAACAVHRRVLFLPVISKSDLARQVPLARMSRPIAAAPASPASRVQTCVLLKAAQLVVCSGRPASVLEEMIYYRLLSQALEQAAEHAVFEELEMIRDLAFEDYDFLLLYEAGSATSWPRASKTMGLMNLDFHSWHKSFT